jgi:hypothetical protein
MSDARFGPGYALTIESDGNQYGKAQGAKFGHVWLKKSSVAADLCQE